VLGAGDDADAAVASGCTGARPRAVPGAERRRASLAWLVEHAGALDIDAATGSPATRGAISRFRARSARPQWAGVAFPARLPTVEPH
jgi:hypothetical protein